MKKLFSLLFVVTLLFGSFVSPTFAANLPVVPTESKTTITIEKSENQSGILKTDVQEVNIGVGRYEKHLGNISFYLQNEATNERVYLNYTELEYTSSNPNIFTVSEDYLHGVKLGSADLKIKYGTQQITLKVNVIDQELTLKFENTHHANYVNLRTLRYVVRERSNHMNVSSKFNSSTGELKLTGIDWSQEGPYYALVVLGNHVYKIEINQNDRNQTITIPYNAADFTKVIFELPQNSNVDNAIISMLNSSNKEISNIYAYINGETYHIANGNYAFNLAGGNGNSVYKGFEGPINLTGGVKTIAIPESKFSKSPITVDFKNSNAILKDVNYCDYSVINRCQPSNIVGKDFYFTTGNYSSGTADVKVGNYIYSFRLDRPTFLSSNQVVIDDQIQSKIKFEDKVYKGGESVYLDSFENSNAYLTLKNKNGNKLMQVRNDLDRENYFGKLILKNNSEVYEVPLENSLSYAHVKLPNVSGTFEVTFTMGEGDNTPDKIRPDVSGTWADWTNSKGAVASNYTWTINLSGEANAATVTNNNIFVVDAEGYLVEGVQVKAVGKQILVSAPANGYEAGKSYKLYIRDAVKNAENKALEKTKMDFSIQK